MTRISHLLLIPGVSLFLIIGSQSNSQTTGHYIDDTAITTSVRTQLATDGPLKTMTQISVKTVENIVYLTGVASTLEAKDRAKESARQLEGGEKCGE